jgi:hypothetical protein
MVVDGMKALRAIMPLGWLWRPLAADLGVRWTPHVAPERAMKTFEANGLTFAVIQSKDQLDVEWDAPVEVEELDALLLAPAVSAGPPRGAPVASWVLARLAALAHLPAAGDRVHTIEGGGYVLELAVLDAHRNLVGRLQLQGDANGNALFGQVRLGLSSSLAIQALVDALLAEPQAVAQYVLKVRDPDWRLDPDDFTPRPTRDSFNAYGWDGVTYLGLGNIRDNPAT